MANRWFALGAVAAGLGVALGAFGAHGLKSFVSEELLQIFETGVRYHLLHAVALLAVGWAADRWPASKWVPRAGWCFLTGIFVFGGSLYVMTLTDLRWLGAITPLGGLLFLAGWASLAIAAARG